MAEMSRLRPNGRGELRRGGLRQVAGPGPEAQFGYISNKTQELVTHSYPCFCSWQRMAFLTPRSNLSWSETLGGEEPAAPRCHHRDSQ
jgi:hypothetical protein